MVRDQGEGGDVQKERTTIDALELYLAWLAFAWGVGRLAKPLYDEVGFPSAALLEFVASGLQYDLTPAFPSRSSCPEAIWQAACYWHELPRRGSAGEQQVPRKGKVAGAFVIGAALGARPAARGAKAAQGGRARKATKKGSSR